MSCNPLTPPHYAHDGNDETDGIDQALDWVNAFAGVSGLNLASLNADQGASTGEFVSTDGTNLIFSGYKGSDIDAKLTGDGIAKITVGITEPATPGTGDLWVDTN